MSSIAKATEFKKDVPLDSIFPRVGNIRRLIKPQVKAAIAATIIANNGLPDEFALILRPVGDRFEAIAGNTRLSISNELKDGNIPEWYSVVSNAFTGNVFTGFKTVPAFVKHLTDEEAFFESARANAQGELTALEYGFGALLIPESKGGRGKEGNISRYASDIGEPVGTVRRWRTAAEVLQELELGDRLEEFNSKTTHLAWVNTAPKDEWRSLVEKIANGITVDALRELLPSNKKAAIALKSNIQESFKTTVDADDAESFLESTLGLEISNQQTDEGGDRTEVDRLRAEVAELKANGYSKVAEAEAQQPVKSSQPSSKKAPTVAFKASDSNDKAIHSSATQEHYTPISIINDVVAVFGAPIALDVASCEAAQRATQAERIFTKDDDGLSQLFEAENVFCNPPGGLEHQELVTDPDTGEVKLKQWGESNQKLWFNKLESEYLDGNAKQAIYIAFNPTLYSMCPSVHRYPICWFDSSATSDCVTGGGRPCFDTIDENGDRVPQKSPRHGGFIVQMPPSPNDFPVDDCKAAIARFEESFKKYGTVTVPEHWRNL